MTNFERIKQMTASEFARWIDAVADACYNKGYHYRNCEGCPLRNVGKCAPDYIAKWLNEEVKEQKDDEL